MFEPDRLRLARDLRERSQAWVAREAHVTPGAISQFESGTTAPTVTTVAALAAALDVPSAWFDLPVAGDTHDGFFRSLRRTPAGKRRQARGVAEVAHDLAVAPHDVNLPDVDIPAYPAGLDATRDEIEEIAGEVRRAWSLKPGPVPNMVASLESHGVVVLRSRLTIDVDAFSLPYSDRPIVMLGTDKDDRARSRFDAAHELGHLVVHGHEVWGLKQVEDQAHWFAAAFLMPADEIRQRLPRTLDWDVFFDLKRRWQVSLAALTRRANVLGRITDTQYLTAQKTISARGWRRVEPIALGPCEGPTLMAQIIRATPRAVRDSYPVQMIDSLAA